MKSTKLLRVVRTGEIVKILWKNDLMTAYNKAACDSNGYSYYNILSATQIPGVFIPRETPIKVKYLGPHPNGQGSLHEWIPVRTDEYENIELSEEEEKRELERFEWEKFRFSMTDDLISITKSIVNEFPMLRGHTCMVHDEDIDRTNKYDGIYIYPDGNKYEILRVYRNVRVTIPRGGGLAICNFNMEEEFDRKILTGNKKIEWQKIED
jgi:hypothetical protein